jgi:prophage regulatory protein
MERMKLYLRDTELAARWDIDQSTVWRLAARGKIPRPLRISGKISRWPIAEIEAHEAALAGARPAARSRANIESAPPAP